ncbi:MAG: arsenate reductase ArsC [Chloroflexi bacterium]|uniref:arsenate reductase ArsC n=1 Tax=Candidatus Flexifilum breve TaxID=3140694 RepID=UPI003137189F|nr:arsenate reductase ArsC [Chloroflexota bacterium]
MTQTRVLILCTANSARSQMAEGLLRHLAGERMEVFSAGSKPSVVNPYAIRAMQARGLDIRGHRSKHLNEYLSEPFDYVITVCDNAAETCPVFPGKPERIHWSFPDPAAVEGDDAKILASFIRVRDDLEAAFKRWLD